MRKEFTGNADDILKALAHPIRRQMLSWMKSPEDTFSSQNHSFDIGVCAGQFHVKSKLPRSTISAHLSVLQQAGLVVPLKVGLWIYYSRNDQTIRKFIDYLKSEL